MSKGVRHADEFKQDALAQVGERDYSVNEVAERLWIRTKSLYTWRCLFLKATRLRAEDSGQAAVAKRLKRELGCNRRAQYFKKAAEDSIDQRKAFALIFLLGSCTSNLLT